MAPYSTIYSIICHLVTLFVQLPDKVKACAKVNARFWHVEVFKEESFQRSVLDKMVKFVAEQKKLFPISSVLNR